ncbi:MAG TPA: hypothetical protein VHV58_00230 [Pseudolabrys sp.]|jgi:hypothetical protein|nr:hypothetical protein [Pseudolabrys sp.]
MPFQRQLKSTANLTALPAILLIAGVLSGCETTGTGAPSTVAQKPPEPMTHSRAASECWMQTEATMARVDLDKRVVVVDKCIGDKMKSAGAPAPAAAAPAATSPATAAPKT